MADSTDVLRIDTPENVSLNYDVAGIGSRFLAALVDTSIIIILQFIVFGTVLWLVLRMDTSPFSGSGPPNDSAFFWILGLIVLISFAFYWGYYIFFEMLWNGQTPGKRWVGLRVIRVDGTPVTASEVVIRNLVRTIDMLPVAYGVGVVTMFVNENSRRLGDLAAGTLVVHERTTAKFSEVTAGMQDALRTARTSGALPAGFPLERLDARNVQIMEEFFMRRARLSNRQQLARQILESIYAHLPRPAEAVPAGDPEDILSAIYAAWKGREAL